MRSSFTGPINYIFLSSNFGVFLKSIITLQSEVSVDIYQLYLGLQMSLTVTTTLFDVNEKHWIKIALV